MKSMKGSTTKRTKVKVKNLPKKSKAMSTKDLKKVKGGLGWDVKEHKPA